MDLIGTIRRVHSVGDASSPADGALEIAGSRAGLQSYADAQVTLTSSTEFFERTEHGERALPRAQLQTAQTVEVWFTGPTQETFPIRATARRVVVVRS
ncbi:MAG: hypothetical protein ABW352_22800 [Polyangiales bacterium]